MRQMLAPALAFALLAGCNGLGEYAVYHVVYQPGVYTADCYSDGEVGDVINDTTTFLSSDTLVIYRGAEDTVYLELEEQTLEGTKDGSELSFYGDAVDTEDADGFDATTTLITSIAVDMDLSGKQMIGDLEAASMFSCVGDDCPDGASASCTVTSEFTGTRIGGVQLTHEL